MNVRKVIIASVMNVTMCACLVRGDVASLATDFEKAKTSTGDAYRDVAHRIVNNPDAKAFLIGKTQNTNDAIIASILLARIDSPDVFKEFQEFWTLMCNRYGNERRNVLISGPTIAFAKKGPERRYVREALLDENGNRVYEVWVSSNGLYKSTSTKYHTVEKYTDVEVEAGIARNKTARKAILEQFLKFMDEGNAYIQEEILDMANEFWRSGRSARYKDEPILDDIIEQRRLKTMKQEPQ